MHPVNYPGKYVKITPHPNGRNNNVKCKIRKWNWDLCFRENKFKKFAASSRNVFQSSKSGPRAPKFEHRAK
jgi:hypothetical protein